VVDILPAAKEEKRVEGGNGEKEEVEVR